MVMYWIPWPVCSSPQEHTTCLHPKSNSLPKIYVGVAVCFSWKEDTTSSHFHTRWQIHSALFLGSRAWHPSLTTLPFCTRNHQPRLSKRFRGWNIYIPYEDVQTCMVCINYFLSCSRSSMYIWKLSISDIPIRMSHFQRCKLVYKYWRKNFYFISFLNIWLTA